MNAFSDKIVKKIYAESDEYIGIPYEATVLYDREKGDIKLGYEKGTPVILYITGANVERIGTFSDEKIISGMLDRGYIVCVIDYLGSEKADTSVLEWSVHKVAQNFISGEYFTGIEGFPSGRYVETLIVPAGYDVSRDNIYWSFDEHGADGSLEKIVDIWNNDFRGVHGELFVKWVDERGSRKETQTAPDGSAPVWYGADKSEDENGQYTKIKYTKANIVSDCAKPDGSMIDLNLYMHVIYPTAPEKKVPVMCLAASAEHLASQTTRGERPHLLGFLFRGYAGVAYDYGYTPMARLDHYGYFDGNSREGCVTGDNVTYSMKVYNYHIDLAAMRYVRYLTLSDGKFAFDVNAVGIYGNSKGGAQTYLGAEDPSRCVSSRIFDGHHGETRYENGKTEDIGAIRGGKEQPWSEYNGEKISSRANLVYSSCGAVPKSITEGNSPMFISCNRLDTSCYTGSNSMVNLCRLHDVPTMWLEIPANHTIVVGEDLLYGVDSYKTFFDFAGYYLKGDAVKAVGARVVKYIFPYSAILLFTGSVSESEMKKVTLKNSKGEKVKCSVVGKFGGLEWTFTPENAEFNETYTLDVPATLVGSNGKKIQSGYTYTFETEKAYAVTPSRCGRLKIEVAKSENASRYIAFEVKNDGVNTVSAYAKDGTRLAGVNVSGKGWYKLDIGDYLDTLGEGEAVSISLKAEKEAGNITVVSEKLDSTPEAVRVSSKVVSEFANAPDGTKALKVEKGNLITRYKLEEFYGTHMQVLGCNKVVKDGPLDESDMGRRFRISFKVYDTATRHISYHLSHCTSKPDSVADYRRCIYNKYTRSGEWVEYSFDYTVHEPMFGDHGKIVKDFYVDCELFGDDKKAIYLADVRSEEIITEVELGKYLFVSAPASEEILPEGKSPIACPNNPWETNLVLKK